MPANDYPVTLTKEFESGWLGLREAGRKGQYCKVAAAMLEAGREGKVRSLKLTFHGESRIENLEKFDLGDGYRLVVEIKDYTRAHRVFRFVGKHDDTERWLNRHQGVASSDRETSSYLSVAEEPSSYPVPSRKVPIETTFSQDEISARPEQIDIPEARSIAAKKERNNIYSLGGVRGGKDDAAVARELSETGNVQLDGNGIQIRLDRVSPWQGKDRVRIERGTAEFFNRNDYTQSPVAIQAAVRVLHKSGFMGVFEIWVRDSGLSIRTLE